MEAYFRSNFINYMFSGTLFILIVQVNILFYIFVHFVKILSEKISWSMTIILLLTYIYIYFLIVVYLFVCVCQGSTSGDFLPIRSDPIFDPIRSDPIFRSDPIRFAIRFTIRFAIRFPLIQNNIVIKVKLVQKCCKTTDTPKPTQHKLRKLLSKCHKFKAILET